MRTWIKRHPVAAYGVITFAISWSLWAVLAITTPSGGMQAGISPAFFILAVLGGLGPSLAGLLVTRVVEGREGVRALWRRLRQGAGAWSWYLVVLLPFAATLISHEVQSALGWPIDLGDVLSRLPLALIWPVFSSLGEELGWRGFALPRLQAQRTAWSSTLILGLLWGMWHLLSDFIGLRHFGSLFLPAFLISGPILLTGHAVIMTWVYNNTKGSVLLSVLYHWAITASAILLGPLDLAPLDSIRDSALGAALIWVAAIVVLARWGGAHLARVPRYAARESGTE